MLGLEDADVAADYELGQRDKSQQILVMRSYCTHNLWGVDHHYHNLSLGIHL